MAAAPIGSPGWPEFAFCTASAESTRMVSIARSSMLVVGIVVLVTAAPACPAALADARLKYPLRGGAADHRRDYKVVMVRTRRPVDRTAAGWGSQSLGGWSHTPLDVTIAAAVRPARPGPEA